MTDMPKLESQGNRPLQMTFEDHLSWKFEYYFKTAPQRAGLTILAYLLK
jgi:hypothetical protein